MRIRAGRESKAVIPGLFALIVWLLVPPILFFVLRPHVAAPLTFLSATLFLPELISFDLPVLPEIGKEELASLAAIVCCIAFAPGALRRAGPGRGPEALMLVLFFGTSISIFNNLDSIRVGPVLVPGVEATSILAAVLSDLMSWGFPFLIGRALITRSEELRDLLAILVIAGLVYSLLILFEVRMAPRLNRMVYGFHQHSFAQALRDGGAYRPMVFMRHGLHVALFTVMYMSAGWILMRTRYRLPLIPFVPKLAVAGYLSLILVLCRSTGALLYGLTIAPLVALAPTRLQIWAAVGIAVLALSYPAIRVAKILPIAELTTLAEEQFGEKRAHSFAGRMRTEEQLTTKIQERPIFGWGSSGRAMVRDEVTGQNLTTYDGVWLILFVRTGLVGFLCVFGLLLAPVFLAALHFGRIRATQDRAMVAGLALMVSIRVFDLLPNSTTEGYLTLLSGALAGAVPGILREQARGDAARREDAAGPGGAGGIAGRDSASGAKAGRFAGGESGPTLGKDLLGPPGLRGPRRRGKR